MKMLSDKRAIDKIYKRRNRYEIPEWQRQEVWSQSKKQSLIDTILRGWKLPKFYFLKSSEEPEEFEVVDGQQRLVSIFEFFDNELPLSPKSAEYFGVDYYKDLSDSLSDKFDDYEIEYDLIEDATEEEVKEFFQRLQEGLPLTSSEKLNSIHSKLRDFVSKLARHPFFSNQATIISNKRYGHFDIVAKVAAIEIDGINVGLRFDDLRAVFEGQATFSENSNVAQRLKGAFDFLNNTFTNANPNFRNRTVVQSLITLTACLVASGHANSYEYALAKFFDYFMNELSRQVELGQGATDADYLDFQRTVSANARSGPRIRQAILVRKLLTYDPSFATLLDQVTIAESGINLQIKKDTNVIQRLIGSLNESYSAEKGGDLFKPTNKTVLSQLALGKQIVNYEEYRELIDNLYFLFHEGVGQRLLGKEPQSFEDVNFLRTGLQHDIDHGATSKVRAKIKKIGEVFKKYSGFSSPQTLAPEFFPVVQANLLATLRIDLEKLTW